MSAHRVRVTIRRRQVRRRFSRMSIARADWWSVMLDHIIEALRCPTANSTRIFNALVSPALILTSTFFALDHSPPPL